MQQQKMQPQPALQKRLRKMVDAEKLSVLCRRLNIGRGHVTQYLAGLPMHATACRGIESVLTEEVNGLQR